MAGSALPRRDMTLDPEFLRQIGETMATGVPQAAALGFRFLSAGDGRGSIEVPWRDDLVGDPDTEVIAGGVVTSLLDHTCGLAITSLATAPFSTATLDLRIDYMRPAAPRAGVIAEAHCYKLTRTIAFVRAEAWDADRADPIATAQAAFVLNRGPGA
ncbi:PaaI family thioesterase [Phenylobacterium sp.]|uniref:PaaI family thioesterase n=1 Tax=Phenylobacterium sp. TaxID=1871053 RepID=UPI003983C85C